MDLKSEHCEDYPCFKWHGSSKIDIELCSQRSCTCCIIVIGHCHLNSQKFKITGGENDARDVVGVIDHSKKNQYWKFILSMLNKGSSKMQSPMAFVFADACIIFFYLGNASNTAHSNLCRTSGFIITTEPLGFILIKQESDFLVRVQCAVWLVFRGTLAWKVSHILWTHAMWVWWSVSALNSILFRGS